MTTTETLVVLVLILVAALLWMAWWAGREWGYEEGRSEGRRIAYAEVNEEAARLLAEYRKSQRTERAA